MSKRELIKNKYGFTLAELLVVVAIIVILVAISIPIFTSQLEKARASTCDANRRSLKAEMSIDYQSGKEFDEGMISKATLIRDYDNNFDFDTFCPSHGEITAEFDGTSFTVFCSEHHPTNFGNTTLLESIFDIFKNDGGNVNLDSGAVVDLKSHVNDVIPVLEEAGLDLNKMGAKSWHYDSTSKMFYWSTQDISEMDATKTKTIPTIRYSGKTGTYTVWNAPIINTTRQGGTGVYYNSFSNKLNEYTINIESGLQPKEDQTYENALKIYNKALGK